MAWDWDKLQQQQKRGGGGVQAEPPGFDEIIEKIRGAKGKLPGGGAWIVILLIIGTVLAFNCIYTVAVEEEGVVQRFGKYHRTTQPGLHFKLPRPIEKVTPVRVRFVDKQEFGFRTLRADVRTRYAPSSAYQSESLMLTGDLNVAVVPWVVHFRIKDSYNYLFKVRNPKSTLIDLAESSMRLVVGDHSVNEVINKREEIAEATQMQLQKELDEAETGIEVTTIEMKTTTVPQAVEPSWNEVNQSIQEKEKMIYQAKEAYNKVIPTAKGQAEKTIKAAEGYALDRVNRAKGDAARFLSLYEEYTKAKDVTRRRLYLEAILEIFPKMGDKYIVDADQKNVLPLLNLGKTKGDQR